MRYGKEIQDIQIHAYRFSVLTGIRPGERTGLKWTDIKGDKLTVRGAINDDQEATRGKNQNASRTISIGPRAKRELAEQRKMLMQRGLISKFVFPDNDGSFIIQKRFRLLWYQYCEHNGIQKVTPYMRCGTPLSAPTARCQRDSNEW